MAFFKSDFFQGLFSGLIPALIAIIFVIQALDQTTDQIKILQEQISYERKPVLVVSSVPNYDRGVPKLTVSNVGNEPAENVRMKLHLMLVSDTSILSVGRRDHPRSYFYDTTRSPREMLWPRLTIYPDSQETDMGHRVYYKVRDAYRDLPDSSGLDERQELGDLRLKLGGSYVLYMELSYRRQSDLVLFTDTTFFRFDPITVWLNPLPDEIGGPAIQERVKSYLFSGPQICIYLYRDRWEIWGFNSTDYRKTRLGGTQVIRR